MPNIVLITRGPLGVTGGPEVQILRNPTPTTNQASSNPAILSEDTLMVQEPSGSGMISLRALRERIGGR